MTETAAELVPPPGASQPKATSFKQVLVFSLVIAVSFTLGLGGFLFSNLKLQKNSQGYVAQAAKRPSPRPSPTLEPTPLPTPNLTPQPEVVSNPPSGKILYLKKGAIWKTNSDRTQALEIAPPDGNDKLDLTLSPDRKKLAFTFLPQNETERQGNPGGRPYTGVSVLNLDDNSLNPVFPLNNLAYSHLAWSPDGRYLSAWVNDGQKLILYDLDQKSIALTYETQDSLGASPFVWIPGQNRLSFILQGELFTVLSDGTDLKSLAKNANARHTTPDTLPTPLAPVWSSDGTHVAFFQEGKLTHLNTASNQTAIVSPNPLNTSTKPTNIPLPIAFSPDQQDLILSLPQASSPTARYNLTSQKITDLPSLGANFLVKNDTLYGATPENPQTITWYPLPGTKPQSCDLEATSYQPTPNSLPLSSRLQTIHPDTPALLNVTRTEQFDTIHIINLETCRSFELTRGPSLDSPIWLPE